MAGHNKFRAVYHVRTYTPMEDGPGRGLRVDPPKLHELPPPSEELPSWGEERLAFLASLPAETRRDYLVLVVE